MAVTIEKNSNQKNATTAMNNMLKFSGMALNVKNCAGIQRLQYLNNNPLCLISYHTFFETITHGHVYDVNPLITHAKGRHSSGPLAKLSNSAVLSTVIGSCPLPNIFG